MKDRVEPINVAPAEPTVGDVYIAPERLYADADGKPVRADDPNRKSLLVAEGAEIPMDRARELGILDMPEADVVVEAGEADGDPNAGADADKADAKAVEAAPKNKALSAPKSTK